jgi:hypothetical protein
MVRSSTVAVINERSKEEQQSASSQSKKDKSNLVPTETNHGISKTKHDRNNTSSSSSNRTTATTNTMPKSKNDLTKLIPGYIAPMKLQVTTITGSCPLTSRNISNLRENSERMENRPLSTLAMQMVASTKTTTADPQSSHLS